MKTVKFYANGSIYMGWKKYNRQENYLEVKSWITSGNKAIIGKKEYTISNLSQLIKE